MPSVTLTNISHGYGHRRLFSEVNFSIAGGDRIALTGANGSGKTTLMRIIARQIDPEFGSLVYEKSTTVAYLPQTGIVLKGSSVYEETERAFDRFHTVVEELQSLEGELAASSTESSRGTAVLNAYQRLQEHLESEGYHRRDVEIKKVLTGLGFLPEQYSLPVENFSSGWQMRIALAKVLLERADILLLDEPTNYLDLEARMWIEQYLSGYLGGLLVVSHDREFLDRTVGRVAELFSESLKVFRGNFSEYRSRRKQELDELIKRREQQQKEIKRIESFIRRFRATASKAKQVQSRVRMLQRMDRIDIPPGMLRVQLQFPDPPHSGKISVHMSSISKAFGDNCVFSDLSAILPRGEKLVVVGPNGAGKSTLLRLISGGEQPSEGTIQYGEGTAIGYFSPEMLREQPPPGTVMEYVEKEAPSHRTGELQNLLGAFLFQGDDVHKSVKVLSGGEKSRLLLLTFLLRPLNLLVLDEPTNHLDMTSKEVLLDALRQYRGTLVFVSHDRYFLRELATSVLDLSGGKAVFYPGDYDYFLWKKDPEREETVSDHSEVDQRNNWHLQKLKKSRLRSLEREENEVVEVLDALKAKQEELEESLADPEVYSDGKRVKQVKEKLNMNRIEQLRASLRWEKIEREIALLGGDE